MCRFLELDEYELVFWKSYFFFFLLRVIFVVFCVRVLELDFFEYEYEFGKLFNFFKSLFFLKKRDNERFNRCDDLELIVEGGVGVF